MSANGLLSVTKTGAERPAVVTTRNTWLLATLLFLFVLPLLAGTYWMYSRSRGEIARAELQSDLYRARSLSAIVERDFLSAENILTAVVARPEVQNAWAHRDWRSIKADFEEAKRLEPAFLSVGVYDVDGTLEAIEPADKTVGDNYAYQDWYHGVVKHWQPYVSDVYRASAKTNPLVVAIAVPIRDVQGKPVGIAMGTYSVAELAGKVSVVEAGDTSGYYVVDQRGAIAASSEINPQKEPLRVQASALAARALEGEEGSEQLQINSQNTFLGFAPISRFGWAALYSRPESVALAPAFHLRRQNRTVGLYLLLVYLATATLAALLMRRQTHLGSAYQTLSLELGKRIAESRLAREELDRYFTMSIDLLCIAGADGTFKRLNPAWEKVLGYSTEELMARPRSDFVHPDDREATARQVEEMFGNSTDAISFENRYRCKDGSYKWLSWDATPLADQQLIYAVARDVTELKLTQEALMRAKEDAERSNKFKDQFLSTMSHELRTPLNAVVGFSDLLAEEQYGPLNDRQKRYVHHIKTGGKHLLRLINDILDLSKIEAGRLQLVVENVPLRASAADALDIMRPLAEKKSQSLTRAALPDLSVRADATRLKQMMLNLLGNAIKFTPEGGEIVLSANAVGEVVRIEIRDSGPGIPRDEQQRIFEAFYRLGHNEQGTEGTGLGLAITRRLAELQGGNLGIDSQPGVGSCFYFTLPMAPGIQKAPSVTVGESGTATRAPLVLVVEDDLTAALLLESQLVSAGFEVKLCDEPHRALEMAAELCPSAVTLDVMMKPISGWELLPALKSDPRTAHIPILVVSIVDEPATAALLGADEYIVKPVETATLLAAVERCLFQRGRAGRARTILVVEDDALAREFVAELLSKHGYAVTTAADGAEARAKVAGSPPELVILDLVLPGVSGFQLLAEWRVDPRTSELPVFVLTSKDLTAQEREHIRTHSSAVFHKQERWQQALLAKLQTIVPVAVTEKT